jgi:nondiscriminating aspartyl-tRNA synthetase
MERIRTTELAHRAGTQVLLRGWLQHRRELANVTFLILRDGAGTAQVALAPAQAVELAPVAEESAIEVVGRAVADERAPGGVEVREARVRVLSAAVMRSPFELGRPRLMAALPIILDHAAVTLRHPPRRAAFRLADASAAAYRGHLRELAFTEVFTPKIVATATESGASCFPIDYFGKRAYLAQSPQFYKQMLVGVFERVYEVAPVFRAEPHDTPRHLNEYVSLDAEMGFITDHHDVMAVLEGTVRAMSAAVSTHPEAGRAGAKLPLVLPAGTFPEIHFNDAQALLATAFGPEVTSEHDLAPAHERWLGEWALSRHASDFLFVTGFPMSKRPFYTHPDPARPTYSNSFDLLFRGLELATGGQRLHLLADYEAALAAREINPAAFDGYLEAFRYGMPPHGGWAIGLERWTQQVIGASNLRETTLFPRDLNRIAP